MDSLRAQLAALLAILIGLVIWFSPHPAALQPEAWRLFALFTATIIAIILKPLPMGAIALIALTIAVSSGVLGFADAFSGLSNEIVWLVVFAFFVARGFISTGLGNRLAYKIMSLLGKNSLGLGYGLVMTDLILAPAIPSVTARVGGIIYPILKSLAEVFTGRSHDPKMGAYLTQSAFQGSAITSAMFLTSMAGNPLIAELARAQGIELSWGGWALAAIVPGLISLAVVPYFLYKIAPPTIRETPHAKQMAEERLSHLGRMHKKEWIMLATFTLLITLWIFGGKFGMKATVATMIGLAVLLVTGVLKWKDVLEETGAWDTFIWFSTLVTLACGLNKLGFTTWLSQFIVANVGGFDWLIGFTLICLIYFYSHYFFASNVAHIGAMYAPLLIISIAIGTPPHVAALVLAFFSNLFGALTHYGSGPAPILFSTGYHTVGSWWKMGALTSFVTIPIWLILGSLWWKLIGLW
ncbi:MAG: putative malate transporter yflS [Chlamydiota bacterium]|jgi:DASS family divalent anion:Na+ symporter